MHRLGSRSSCGTYYRVRSLIDGKVNLVATLTSFYPILKKRLFFFSSSVRSSCRPFGHKRSTSNPPLFLHLLRYFLSCNYTHATLCSCHPVCSLESSPPHAVVNSKVCTVSGSSSTRCSIDRQSCPLPSAYGRAFNACYFSFYLWPPSDAIRCRPLHGTSSGRRIRRRTPVVSLPPSRYFGPRPESA